MLGIFGKQKKEKENFRYLSDILVNDSDGESRHEVHDYTKNPTDFLIDIHEFPLSRLSIAMSPIIKVNGIVAGLKTKSFCSSDNSSEYTSLNYEGFLLINSNFPLYFSAMRFKEEIPNLGLEELMLESAKKKAITITGRLFKPRDSGKPYSLMPFVLQLGEYISPGPKIV
jgi:hypothetical protein